MDGTESLVCCKAIATPEREVSVSKREVTSYKAMFGNVDRVREIVDPGAFFESIGPKGRLAKGQVTTRHNHKDLVGKMVAAEETIEGLLTTDKYGVDPVSDRVFSLVRDGIIQTSSFQARFKPSQRVKAKGPDGEPVWHLTTLDLIEAGPADPDFAVNPETRVVAVKGLQEIASVLSNLSGLESQEVWTMDSLKKLSPEDKDALLMILRQMPTGMACEAIIAGMEADNAEDPADGAMGKAVQIVEAYSSARWDGLLERIFNSLTKCRPSAATN